MKADFYRKLTGSLLLINLFLDFLLKSNKEYRIDFFDKIKLIRYKISYNIYIRVINREGREKKVWIENEDFSERYEF